MGIQFHEVIKGPQDNASLVILKTFEKYTSPETSSQFQPNIYKASLV